MNSINTIARIAGILALVTVVIAPFSMVYVPSTLVVQGDAAATAARIMASEGLFRMALASDAVVFLVEIALTVLLYVLLKPVNKTIALVAAYSRLAMTVVQGINLLNHFVVLLLLGGASYLTAFAPEQRDALALLFLNAHADVVLIWGLFFSMHLFAAGYLMYTSGYLPKFLGVILVIVGACYLVQSFGTILLPQYKALFVSIGFLAIIEIAYPLWFIIKGVNVEEYKKRVLASA